MTPRYIPQRIENRDLHKFLYTRVLAALSAIVKEWKQQISING
jgi:hypothetical protein